jgi:hypothetical protein
LRKRKGMGGISKVDRSTRVRHRHAGEPGLKILQILAQLGDRDAARRLSILPDPDLRQNPGELPRSQPPVFLGRGLEVTLDRVARMLQGPNVNQIPDLRAGQESAKLVGEDLFRRIDTDAVDDKLLGVKLWSGIANEIDHESVLSPAKEISPEVRIRLDRFDRSSEIPRGGRERGGTRLDAVFRGEKVEILGSPMAEVESGEGRASGQEESLFQPEEALQDLPLKAIEG